MKGKSFKTIILFGLLSISLANCGAEHSSGPQGPQGVPGNDGVSIISVTLTSSSENIDTYTITYSDDHTSTFKVTNGVDGESIQGEPGKDGHTPEIKIGENGNWLVDGVDTEIKAQGPQGPIGPQGEPGKDGSSIITASGVPDDNLGKNGDSYIDLDNWNYYIKENGAWNLKGNIKGNDGKPGTQGPQGEPGKDGLTISSIEKTDSQGKNDIYTITYSDGSSTTFSITNNALNSISANNIDFICNNIVRNDRTYNNVSFTWNNDLTCNVFSSGASSTAFNDFIKCNLPDGMKAGGTYYVRFVSTDSNVDMRVLLIDSANNTISTQIFPKDGYLYVPDNTVKITCRFMIYGGKTADATISEYAIYKYKPEYLNPIYTHGCPKIIVFKDDDTTNDTSIQRYRDACRHNGIVGSYATITGRITNNIIDVNKLLQFEQEGFTVMCHCNQQLSNDYWTRPNLDAQLQREDMATVIRVMRQSGFINYMYWQTPGGIFTDDILHTCRSYGFKTLGTKSYGNAVSDAYNHIENLSRYNLVTYSMKHNDTSGIQTLDKAKNLIDMFSSSNGGMLILTTHFADWESLTWNTTIDKNGFPIGYERFNELAQYAINSGCQIMNYADAVATMEPFFID